MESRVSKVIASALVAYGVGSAAAGSTTDAGSGSPAEDATEEAVREPAIGLRLRLDRFQKRHRPLAFGYAVVKKYGEDGGGRLASTVAYYGFFSVFPALLALVAIAGFVLDGNPDLRADVIDTAVGQFPVIGESVAEESLGGNGLAVFVGVLGALWAGLGAMLAAEHAFNTVWDIPWHERPDPIRARLRGLLMFIVIGVGVVAATILTNIVAQVSLPGATRIGIAAANIGVNVLLAWVAFQVLTARTIEWRDVWPGAVTAGLFFYGFQNLGSLLVSRYVANASDTYGTFALVIGLLAWFHLVSQATLLSAELNVVRNRALYPRTLFGNDLTDGDRRALAGFQRAAARHPSVPPAGADDVRAGA